MANLGTLPLIVAELKNTPPQNGNSSFYEHHGRLILIAVIANHPAKELHMSCIHGTFLHPSYFLLLLR